MTAVCVSTNPNSREPSPDADAPNDAGSHHHRRRGPVALLLVALIRIYQAARAGRPSPCRYVPSCSFYAVEALERHGAIKGSWLAARRLSRCHPWGGHGADPVPQ